MSTVYPFLDCFEVIFRFSPKFGRSAIFSFPGKALLLFSFSISAWSVNDDVEPVSAGLVGGFVDDSGATPVVVARTRVTILTMTFVD